MSEPSSYMLIFRDTTPERYEEYIRKELKGLSFAPIAIMSAKDGLNIRETMDVAFDLNEQASTRVGTGQLNWSEILAAADEVGVDRLEGEGLAQADQRRQRAQEEEDAVQALEDAGRGSIDWSLG